MNDQEKLYELLLEDIREVKSDVKSLLALKYQIFGMVTGITFIVSLLWDIILK